MKKTVAGCVLAVSVVSGAYAATTMTAAPPESWTVTNYYKQDVYDPNNSKIGAIEDVLLDKSGKVTGLVVGVGGFLGAGENAFFALVPFGDPATAASSGSTSPAGNSVADTAPASMSALAISLVGVATLVQPAAIPSQSETSVIDPSADPTKTPAIASPAQQ